jgi:hypothetical protein
MSKRAHARTASLNRRAKRKEEEEKKRGKEEEETYRASTG